MINCPKCGAANPDHNLFCDRCDTMLPPSGGGRAAGGLRCPMCGKVNPEGSVTCGSCGARLAPITGSLAQEPPSAPARPAPAETPAVRKAAAPPPAPASRPQEPAPGGADDWLSRLRGTMPESPTPEEDIPDWLRGEPAAQPEAELPAIDLAARLGGAEPSQEVPDWLAQPAAPSAEEIPDWLKPSGPAPAPKAQAAPTPTTPKPSEAEAPDWLKPSAPAARPSTPAARDAELPDWLQQLAPAAAPAPKAAPMPPAPAPSEAEVPDWLKPLAPAAVAASVTPRAAPKPPTPAAPPAAETELPDWLKEPAPVSKAPPKPAAPVTPSQVPDWLQELAPSTAAAPEEAPLPDWLKPPAPTPAAPAPLASELPREAWLQEIGTGPTPEVQAPEVPSEFVEPAAPAGVGEPEMPDWLRAIAPAAPVAPAPGGPAFVGEQEPAPVEAPTWLGEVSAQPTPVQAELPDWLQELKVQAPVEAPALMEEAPAAPQQVFTEPPAAVPVAAGGLVAAQLPAWLQKLAPKGQVQEEEKEPVETEGILAGVRGPLQIAEIVAQQVSGEPRRLHPEIPANDLARAGALQELLARGATIVVRRETESRAQRLLGGVERGLAFLLIAIAVLVPVLFAQIVYDMKLVSVPPLSDAALEMYQKIDTLQPNSTVLVAFDYDATQSAEMDTQARALLAHLNVRKANIKFVSLYPSGPAIAQSVINQVNQPLTLTERLKITKNLGYVPGQDMGVASIMPDVITSSLVIELAASPETVRWWVEQISAQTAQRPLLLAGVSAAAEPMSLPYYYSQYTDGSRQIAGMLSGVPGATSYRLRLRQAFPQYEKESEAYLLAPLASIGLASLVLVVWMVLGSLRYIRSGGRRK